MINLRLRARRAKLRISTTGIVSVDSDELVRSEAGQRVLRQYAALMRAGDAVERQMKPRGVKW